MLKFKIVNIIAILSFVVFLLLHFYFDYSIFYLLFLLILWFFITAFGSGFIGWNYHLVSLNSNSSIQKNQVAITFDDGPHPEFTSQALDLLRKNNAKATFFCIGKNIKKYPELFQKIINEGHTVGNHTYSHPNNFGFLKTNALITEICKTNEFVHEFFGLKLRLFRPPFGVTNPRIKIGVNSNNMQSIGWNKRSLDTTGRSEAVILKRIIKKLNKGDVILLHDTNKKSILVLEQLLIFLKQQNMESVTINSLFNIKAYA